MQSAWNNKCTKMALEPLPIQHPVKSVQHLIQMLSVLLSEWQRQSSIHCHITHWRALQELAGSCHLNPQHSDCGFHRIPRTSVYTSIVKQKIVSRIYNMMSFLVSAVLIWVKSTFQQKSFLYRASRIYNSKIEIYDLNYHFFLINSHFTYTEY